jgi:hypothetical protein
MGEGGTVRRRGQQGHAGPCIRMVGIKVGAFRPPRPWKLLLQDKIKSCLLAHPGEGLVRERVDLDWELEEVAARGVMPMRWEGDQVSGGAWWLSAVFSPHLHPGGGFTKYDIC